MTGPVSGEQPWITGSIGRGPPTSNQKKGMVLAARRAADAVQRSGVLSRREGSAEPLVISASREKIPQAQEKPQGINVGKAIADVLRKAWNIVLTSLSLRKASPTEAKATVKKKSSVGQNLFKLAEEAKKSTTDAELDVLIHQFDGLTKSPEFSREAGRSSRRAGVRLLEQDCREAIVTKRLFLQGFSQENAEKIAHGLVHDGEGLVEEKKVSLVVGSEKNTQGEDIPTVRPKPYVKGEPLKPNQKVITKTLPHQIHGIDGVNVHRDPRTGRMVVDVGEEELASGTTKRIKDALRLTDRGDVEQIVRHTMKGKEKESVKKGDLSFELTELAQDERDELKVRDELGQASEPTPGIVPIFEYEFINKKGEYKKRFFSERCDGDVTSLIFTKKKGGGLEPLPPEQRDTKRALHLLRDSVDIFERLHEAGLALLDLRLANILRKKDRPLLSDMASCTPMGCQFNRLLPGDDQIRPPEVLYAEKGKEPVLDEKSDLYAFGLALWEAYDPDGVAAFRDERFDGRQLLSLNAALAEGRSKGETPEILKKAKELDAERAQKRLGKLTASGDPVQGLIAELLDPDSTKRPQSFAEVKDKFSPALADYDAKERPSQPLGPEAIRRSVSPSSGV